MPPALASHSLPFSPTSPPPENAGLTASIIGYVSREPCNANSKRDKTSRYNKRNTETRSRGMLPYLPPFPLGSSLPPPSFRAPTYPTSNPPSRSSPSRPPPHPPSLPQTICPLIPPPHPSPPLPDQPPPSTMIAIDRAINRLPLQLRPSRA